MCTSAQYPPPVPQGYISLDGNCVCANHRAVRSSLTLDFATFSISANRTNNRVNDNNVMIESHVTDFAFSAHGVRLFFKLCVPLEMRHEEAADLCCF